MWPFAAKIDPTLGDPRARALLTALRTADRATVREIFTATTDPDERAFLMVAADDVPGVQDWIGQWIADEPESTLPVLIRGCHAVSWAWEARGSRRANVTSKSSFQEFFRRLRIAENCLDEVIERDPDEVLAWTWLTTSARGRQIPAEQAAARFREVTKRAPFLLHAHEQRLQYLCRKWFGSHQEMFAFAREATASAPAGHPLPGVLASAHIEYWLDLPAGQDDTYMTTPAVRADLIAAAEKSVLHPDFVKVAGWATRANTLAMALHMGQEFAHAARVFDVIGDNVTEWPWFYRTLFGGPARKFAQARRDAYRARG
ncbi:DUF4034 domain-containing protein [Actinoplanes regularis]|uniref:DUF4034 domain-containing protein n=1 Tax=Actinoplanes regularis TaxID=52697 RepID=UPI0024A346C9|nr:DUF4034 domain-containing protein [Actinoplanes regularis]GLW30144.1 hypothetical protein Areg01_30840 [Actinoplanes regularis]